MIRVSLRLMMACVATAVGWHGLSIDTDPLFAAEAIIRSPVRANALVTAGSLESATEDFDVNDVTQYSTTANANAPAVYEHPTAGKPCQQDLFYNYYIATGGGIPAAMYQAPRPVPPLVGHVYYTYQPLLPHEYLYRHHREYYTNYGSLHGFGGSGGHASYNRTIVRYARGTILPTYLYKLTPAIVPNIPFGP